MKEKDITYDLTLRHTPFSVTHFKGMGECLEILENSDYRVLWAGHRGHLLYDNGRSGDDFKVRVLNNIRLNDLGVYLNYVPICSKKSKYPGGYSPHEFFCSSLDESYLHAHMMEATEKSKALYPNAPKRFLVIEKENGDKKIKKLVCIICISE